MTSVREYEIRTHLRAGTLTVTEAPDQVRVTLKFNRYGVLGDEPELERELGRVLDQCARESRTIEPRPIVLESPDVGQRSLIIGGTEQ
jgi:hypothetical protein